MIKKKRKDCKILVIDDDAEILKLIEAILASAGYQVESALSGRKALEIAEIADGNVDLLLTDVVMPEMNGEELALVFKQAYPRTKVIFMSAYLRPAAARFEEYYGKTDFILKPFTPEKLIGQVKRALF
ncbi:MAG: response regulator [Deltaproteobacteria bacterium]|nr:response regulator [Deltaproteobacteria bacterium]